LLDYRFGSGSACSPALVDRELVIGDPVKDRSSPSVYRDAIGRMSRAIWDEGETPNSRWTSLL
jgi:hypothetical protein